MYRLIINLLIAPLLLPVALAATNSVNPNTVVAHFGDVPIYAEEFTFHIRDHVALVAVHFKSRHQIDLSGDNWLQSYQNVIPAELLIQRSLESCRRSKAIQLLALKHKLGEKLPFPGFQENCNQINQARAQGKAEGRVLFGPVEYSPAQLYKYKLSNMRNHLRDYLSNEDYQQREALLEEKITKQLNAMPVALKKDTLDQLVALQVGSSNN